MKIKFVWFSALALSLMLGQAVSASTTDTNQSKKCTCHYKFQRLSDKLNLTADQKTKIKAIRIQERNNEKANQKQLKAIRLQINDLANNDKVDESKLDSLISQRNKIKGATLKNQVMMQNQIYNLLTPKQKTQYKAMTAKWDAKHD